MELSKIQIAKLDGLNWTQWKYRMSALLRGIDGLIEIVEGKVKKPEKPGSEAGDAAAAALVLYEETLRKVIRLNSTALLLITNNITDEVLDKVIRFDNPKDVWDELHRLYEGVNEDRLYDACLQFFKSRKDPSDDIRTYISKLKNLWHVLKQELVKSGEGTDLPEFLLICKILDTLPDTYFSFKSSWMLMSKKDRTVESLTSQLCVHEKALTNCQDGESGGEALTVKTCKHKQVKKVPEQNPGTSSKESRRCFICKEQGHLKKDCPKKKSGCTGEISKAGMMLTSIFSLTGEDRDSWHVDNGATSHVTMRADLFEDFEEFEETHTVTTADGSIVKAIGKGSIQFATVVNGKSENFYLRDVWYVPKINRNLYSVLAAQDRNPTSVFESRVTSCIVKINGKVIVTGKRMRYGGLYKLDCKAITPTASINLTVAQKEDKLQLYHERMGHQNKRHVKRLIEREFGIKTTDNKELCDGCIFGKSHRRKFGIREKATKPGERIHTDVCGAFPESGSKFRYFLIFVDEFTHFRFLYLLKNKSEVHEKLRQMLAEAKNSGHAVQELLSDGGGEFNNENIQKILAEYGVRQRLVMPYTPEQNGVSERENRTVVECARSMMYAHEDLPQKLWAELVNTAVYILNRTGPTTVEDKSPYELWFGKKPQIKHLRIIGSSCYAHVPNQKRKKLDKKAVKCRLIGYDNDDGCF